MILFVSNILAVYSCKLLELREVKQITLAFIDNIALHVSKGPIIPKEYAFGINV